MGQGCDVPVRSCHRLAFAAVLVFMGIAVWSSSSLSVTSPSPSPISPSPCDLASVLTGLWDGAACGAYWLRSDVLSVGVLILLSSIEVLGAAPLATLRSLLPL